MSASPGLPLSLAGLNQALAILGVDAATLWAVFSVETGGFGFLRDRRPAILFERHVFCRLTGGKFDATHPDLSNPVRGGYGDDGAHQHERLERAKSLDLKAALSSASWGLGQVLGENAALAGYADVVAFAQAMERSEDAQLAAMATFVTNKHLDAALRAGAWSDFARGYNGPKFRDNDYDGKLERAHSRFLAGLTPDVAVRTAQACLTYLGYDPGPVDGFFGNRTFNAVHSYQTAKGLPQTGRPDGPTLAALTAQALG